MVLLRGFHSMATFSWHPKLCQARLAQSVEHQTFNLRVAGSSPSSGEVLFHVSIGVKIEKAGHQCDANVA